MHTQSNAMIRGSYMCFNAAMKYLIFNLKPFYVRSSHCTLVPSVLPIKPHISNYLKHANLLLFYLYVIKQTEQLHVTMYGCYPPQLTWFSS